MLCRSGVPSSQYKDEKCASLLAALLSHDDKTVKAIIAKDAVGGERGEEEEKKGGRERETEREREERERERKGEGSIFIVISLSPSSSRLAALSTRRM